MTVILASEVHERITQIIDGVISAPRPQGIPPGPIGDVISLLIVAYAKGVIDGGGTLLEEPE